MRPACLAVLFGTFIACGHSQRDDGHTTGKESPWSGRVVFGLTRLDGKRLPTGYSTPRGLYIIHAGQLTLDPNGHLSFQTDVVPYPDTVDGHASRMTYASRYERAGPDSLVFPADGGATPEFFGRLDGAGGLRLVAHPLPRASAGPSKISVAAEQGGAHAWEFHLP
jgi:hypothetical protein